MDPLTFFGYLIYVVALLLIWGALYAVVWGVEKYVIGKKIFSHKVRSVIRLGSLVCIVLIPAIQGYLEDNPGNEFYRDQWTVFTKIDLPNDAVQVAVDYGPSDLYGDYTLAVAFKLNNADYRSLRNRSAELGIERSNFASGQEEWYVLADLALAKEDFDLWVGSKTPNEFPTYKVGFHGSTQTIVLSGFRSY